MARRALITGITGQDGSYLAEFLLAKGYCVYGLTRLVSSENFARLAHIREQIRFVPADLSDQNSIVAALETGEPDEIYNLAAESFVPASWHHPVATGDCAGLGVTRILEAIRTVSASIRLYQASSSEIFGTVQESPQNEKTRFCPRNPYGVAKLYAHLMIENYRLHHGLFCVSGILFNHDSPRRNLDFVTRKVSHAVASIRLGRQKYLKVGNLDAERDWGFAGDYVEAMWLMLRAQEPQDFVIGTGVTHSVRELLQTAFEHADMDFRDFVQVDPALYRPVEEYRLCADFSSARASLKWKPKVSFKRLVRMMVDSDLISLERAHLSESVLPTRHLFLQALHAQGD